MLKSKLIQIFKQLEARELNRLKKYIQSPFFNKHQDVLNLFEYLMHFAPDFDHPQLQKKAAIKALEMEQDPTHFYHVTSYLLELVCDFLAYLEQEKNKLQQKQYTIKALRKRGLKKQLTTSIRQFKTIQKHSQLSNSQLYLEQYAFFDELDALFLEQSSSVLDKNVQLKSNHLDLFYLSSKLKIACDMLSRNIVIKANYTCHLIPELMTYLDQHLATYAAYPIISLYHKVYKMLTQKEEIYYYALKEALSLQASELSTEEAKSIYDYAENYCIRKINSGQRTYYREFLDLYKVQLQLGTLLTDGYMSEQDYKNIVTAGVRTKDYQWTEAFIHNNKNVLKEVVRENAFIYNLAAFYYATKQYTKALKALNNVTFTEVTYHLGAKDIQLKIYYELGESEAFSSLVQAFKIYVKRNKQLSEYRKEVYLNYLKIAKKMEALKEKKAYISLEKFKKEKTALQLEIQSIENIANSDWIDTVWQQISR